MAFRQSTPAPTTTPGPARVVHATAAAARATPYNPNARPARMHAVTPPAGGSPLFSASGSGSLPLSSLDTGSVATNMNRAPSFNSESPTGPTSLDTLTHLSTLPGRGLASHAAVTDSVDSFYPAYTASAAPIAAGHSLHGGASLLTQSTHVPPSQPFSARELELLIQKYDLAIYRNKIHDFNQVSTENQMVVLFTQELSTDMKLGTLIEMVAALTNSVNKRLDNLENVCQTQWTPLKAHTKILRALTRHYFCKPVATYGGLINYLKSYIHNNADLLNLSTYKTHPVIRTILITHLTTIVNDTKSNFRKMLWTSILNKDPLKVFAKSVFQGYHLVPVPEEVPDVMLATFAYMRQIAEPMVKKEKTSDRSDNGFWKAMDKGLGKGYDDFGKGDRATNMAWVEWGKGKVAWDERKFPPEDDIIIMPNEADINQSYGNVAQPGDENDVGVTGQSADAYLNQGPRSVAQLEGQMRLQADAAIVPEDEDGEDVDMNVLGPQLQTLAEV